MSGTLEWVRSGQATKSVFSLARSARDLGLARVSDDLGIVNRHVVEALLIALMVSPLLGGVVVLLLAYRRYWATVVVCTLLSIVGVASALIAMRFMPGSLLGPKVALVAGVIAGAGAATLAASQTPSRTSRKGPVVPG